MCSRCVLRYQAPIPLGGRCDTRIETHRCPADGTNKRVVRHAQIYGANLLERPRIDAADYVGPVTTKQMLDKGGGRGIVTTRDVAPGELLLGVKAFAAVYPDNHQNINVMTLNLLTQKLNTSTQVHLMGEILYKLLDSPESSHSI